MISLFLSALMVGFSGALMPGSLLTYTLRQSLSVGPKSGFIIIAGHALLELVLIVCIFLGLDMVLKSNTAQTVIGLIGGALLCYMGVDMISKAMRKRLSISMDSTRDSTKSMLISGMLISAANPYFLLWWAVIGLGFLMEAYRTHAAVGVAMYFFGHIFADFIWYGLISVVVGTTRKFIKETPYRIVIMLLGGLLIFFGARFFISALALVS